MLTKSVKARQKDFLNKYRNKFSFAEVGMIGISLAKMYGGDAGGLTLNAFNDDFSIKFATRDLMKLSYAEPKGKLYIENKSSLIGDLWSQGTVLIYKTEFEEIKEAEEKMKSFCYSNLFGEFICLIYSDSVIEGAFFLPSVPSEELLKNGGLTSQRTFERKVTSGDSWIGSSIRRNGEPLEVMDNDEAVQFLTATYIAFSIHGAGDLISVFDNGSVQLELPMLGDTHLFDFISSRRQNLEAVLKKCPPTHFVVAKGGNRIFAVRLSGGTLVGYVMDVESIEDLYALKFNSTPLILCSLLAEEGAAHTIHLRDGRIDFEKKNGVAKISMRGKGLAHHETKA